MSDSILIFLQLGVMLAAATFFGRLAQKIRIPAVIGEIFGGILLGPSFAGHFIPGIFESLFPVSGTAVYGREAVIKLGMLFFLFVTGMEINPDHLKRKTRAAIWISVLGTAVPFAAGFLVVVLMPNLWTPYAPHNLTDFALFLGTALSISALPVIARILTDLKLIRTEMGTLVLSTATVGDLIGWALFGCLLAGHHELTSHTAPSWILTGLTLLIFTAFIFRRWLPRQTAEDDSNVADAPALVGPAIVMMLAAGVLAQAAGAHAVFGAFLIGIILGRLQGAQKLHTAFRDLAVNFFAPVYFVSVGLKLNFHLHFDWKITGVIFLIACAGKILGAVLGGWLGRLALREALAVGAALNARGAIEIILVSVAFEFGLIPEAIYLALVLMALFTTLLSGPLIQFFLAPKGLIRHA